MSEKAKRLDVRPAEVMEMWRRRERQLGPTKIIPEEVIKLDSMILAVYDTVADRLVNTFSPRFKVARIMPKNRLFSDESRGWMSMGVETMEAGEVMIVDDFRVESVGNSGQVGAGTLPLKPGCIEFHTHVDPKYVRKVDVGDVCTALTLPEFVDPNGQVHSGVRMWGLVSIDRKERQLWLDIFKHDMAGVQRTDNGGLTSGLSKLSSKVKLDLR